MAYQASRRALFRVPELNFAKKSTWFASDPGTTFLSLQPIRTSPRLGAANNTRFRNRKFFPTKTIRSRRKNYAQLFATRPKYYTIRLSPVKKNDFLDPIFAFHVDVRHSVAENETKKNSKNRSSVFRAKKKFKKIFRSKKFSIFAKNFFFEIFFYRETHAAILRTRVLRPRPRPKFSV